MSRSNWYDEFRDAFPNVSAFSDSDSEKVQQAVFRWENTIRKLLRRGPNPGEISDAIRYAQQHFNREEFRYTPPGPQDIASWINYMRHDASVRQEVKDTAGRVYRKVSPEEADSIKAALHAFTSTLNTPDHVEMSLASGYRMLEKGEIMLYTDQYWDRDKNDWLPVADAATHPDGHANVFMGYKGSSVRRRVAGKTTPTVPTTPTAPTPEEPEDNLPF